MELAHEKELKWVVAFPIIITDQCLIMSSSRQNNVLRFVYYFIVYSTIVNFDLSVSFKSKLLSIRSIRILHGFMEKHKLCFHQDTEKFGIFN